MGIVHGKRYQIEKEAICCLLPDTREQTAGFIFQPVQTLSGPLFACHSLLASHLVWNTAALVAGKTSSAGVATRSGLLDQ